MKRLLSVLFILCFLFSSACAWTCGSCGNQTSSDNAKFCGVCGQPSPAPELTSTPTPTEVSYTGDPSKAGSYVTFGHYEQDNNLGNGKEPIEWIVLKYDGVNNKSLLLSRYGLDAHRFDVNIYPGWGKSEIRNWLNSTFLNAAFTKAEQKKIITTQIKTPRNGGTSGGSTVADKLWLLSYDEAKAYTYFKDDQARKLLPTKYAAAQGAEQYSGTDSSSKLNGSGCCWWWLRSPSGGVRASVVSYTGSYFSSNEVYGSGAVRPALWLDLTPAAQ